MKVSIVPNFNTVTVDGVTRSVDLSCISTSIHAIQWDDESGLGEVEYVKPANRRFSTLDEIIEPDPVEGKVPLSREAIEGILAAHAAALEPKDEG